MRCLAYIFKVNIFCQYGGGVMQRLCSHVRFVFHECVEEGGVGGRRGGEKAKVRTVSADRPRRRMLDSGELASNQPLSDKDI